LDLHRVPRRHSCDWPLGFWSSRHRPASCCAGKAGGESFLSGGRLLAPEIIVVCKSWLEMSPPVLTIVHVLRELGHAVLCICSGCRPQTRSELEAIGVRLAVVHPEDPHPRTLPGKIAHYARFRRRAWQVLDDASSSALVWVARGDTAIALGRRLLERRYVWSLHELHDGNVRYQQAIRLYAPRAATLVVPEYCRANILRFWHGLRRTPLVLPNRPVLKSRRRKAVVSDANAAKILNSLPEDQEILLYQGALDRDRDIEAFAHAARELGGGFCFLIMGEDRTGDLPRLRQICPDLVHVPWVPPPSHLEVTSHAHIGVAFYKFDSLNSIFCAPNKIWEYSAYGVPMICQDVPGLRYTVGVAEAGLCVDTNSVDAIIAGVRAIAAEYQHFSRNATEFYDSVDTKATISRILSDACAYEP